jgi:hypothetical protein
MDNKIKKIIALHGLVILFSLILAACFYYQSDRHDQEMLEQKVALTQMWSEDNFRVGSDKSMCYQSYKDIASQLDSLKLKELMSNRNGVEELLTEFDKHDIYFTSEELHGAIMQSDKFVDSQCPQQMFTVEYAAKFIDIQRAIKMYSAMKEESAEKRLYVFIAISIYPLFLIVYFIIWAIKTLRENRGGEDEFYKKYN